MPYTSTSGAAVKTHLTGRVGGNSTFWAEVEKKDAFNEALSFWNLLTGEFTTSFSTSADGSTFYDVPRQMGAVLRVSFNGVGLPSTTVDALDMGEPGWQTIAAASPTRWAPVGLTKILLNPAPASGTILFEGIAETPHLRNDGDKMDLGDEYLDALLSYGHHYLAFKDGGAEFQATSTLLQKMVAEAAKRNSRFIKTSFYRRMMGIEDSVRKPRSLFRTLGARQ